MGKKICLAGLGNPGKEYEKTRHSIGFRIADAFCQKNSISCSKDKNKELAKCILSDAEVFVIKPLEYMNLSGNTISALIREKNIPQENLLVWHDEVDLPFGEIRMKNGGGHAGHNGLRDIIAKSNDPSFARIRFGVGRPSHPGMSVADFVLSRFNQDEEESIPKLIEKALELTAGWIESKQKSK